MASEHLPAVWKRSHQTGSALLVLVAVASHSDANGVWIADQATLQSCVRLSRRRVQQILAELVASGELAVVSHHGRGKLSTYRLLVGAEKAKPSAPFQKGEAAVRLSRPKRRSRLRPSWAKGRSRLRLFSSPVPPFSPGPPNPPLPPRQTKTKSGDLRSPAPGGAAERRLSSQPAARRGRRSPAESGADRPVVEDARRHRAAPRAARPAHPRRPGQQARADRLRPPGRHRAGRETHETRARKAARRPRRPRAPAGCGRR